MRQRAIALVTSYMLLTALLAGVALAQTTDASLVGTWLMDVDVAGTEDPPALMTASADGTLRISDCCNTGAGVWSQTGDGTAEATVLLPWWDDEGFVGYSVIRGEVVLGSDGASLTATYTQEVPLRDGGTTGQLGPAEASASRLTVEAMGDPVAPIPRAAGSPAPSPGASASRAPGGSPILLEVSPPPGSLPLPDVSPQESPGA